MEAIAAPRIAILVFAIILIFTMVKSVPQGENWTVERFGRYTRTLDPGLRFLVPLIDRVGAKINMMETVLDIEEQEVITRDNAMVVADAVAFYQVVDAVEGRLRGAEPRAGAEEHQPDQHPRGARVDGPRRGAVEPRRDQPRLLSVIDNASTPWGVKVTRVEIRDLAPPPDIIRGDGAADEGGAD